MSNVIASVVPQLSALFNFWNLLGVTCTLLYYYWWKRSHPRFPPGPRGIPLFGVVPFLGGFPARDFKRWSVEKYGAVMSARMGREDVVVLNTVEAINQALVKQSASFSDRPWVELICRGAGQGGISFHKYDEEFKSQKHFALKFLRDKGLGRRKMEEIINEEGDLFVDFLKKHDNGPINLKKYLYWLTSNVISRTALGKRYDYGDPEFLELLDVLALIYADPKDAPKTNMIMMFGFLSKIPPFAQAMTRFIKKQGKILSTMQRYIEDHKAKFDKDNVDDFIDAFLFEKFHGNECQNQSFTEEQLRVYCKDLFIAGSETSSTTLSWFIVYLLNYPEYHKTIEQEIEEVFGSQGIPRMSERDSLPMTCAFMEEVMRIKTLVPLSIQHCTTSACELFGYVIPKGTTILPNLEGAHMNAETWPNPEHFNPKRHINSEGKFSASNQVIPFSMGGRFCLGESLARAELFIFLVKLIQKFQIRPATDGVPPPTDREIMALVMAPRDCNVRLEFKGYQ